MYRGKPEALSVDGYIHQVPLATDCSKCRVLSISVERLKEPSLENGRLASLQIAGSQAKGQFLCSSCTS